MIVAPSYVNILVHGLFFMEFTGTGLTLTAPSTGMHLYRYGRGGFLCQVSDPGQ